MKNYLSFGGGVNSVALDLYLLSEGWDFEAVFVDHGTDWPETYEYFKMYQEWRQKKGHSPITVLKPDVEGFNTVYDYCWNYKILPGFLRRFCTDKFKVRPLLKYFKSPCFSLIGFSSDESKRAKISTANGIEKRYPLIEAEIDREGCKKIIKDHGLPVPMKSSCYICPFQRVGQWKQLRREHPDLFCKAEQLEQRGGDYREDRGKPRIFLTPRRMPINILIGENQKQIFKQDEYPPCECML